MKNIILILLLVCNCAYSQSAFSFRNAAFVGALKPKAKSGNTLLTSLFSYWKLDETGTYGARADSSANHVDLDAPNGADYSAGLINYAYYCPENNDGYLINVDSVGQNIYGASEFTISFWVNWSLGPSEYDAQGIISIGEGFCIQARPYDGAYSFFCRTADPQADSNYYISYNFGSANFNSWDHVVVTRSLDGYLRFYVNNSLTDTIPISGAIQGNPYDIFSSSDIILGRLVYGYPLYGSIDEFGVWTRALTSLEVESLYNGGNGKPFNTF
jgi:hypothetical protein